MLLNCYSVYDEVSLTYATPFFTPQIAVSEPNHKIAIRLATNLVNDSQSQVFLTPSDFSLYYIGVFDDQTSIIEKIQPAIRLLKFNELVKPKE